MSGVRREINRLLNSSGAVLVRQTKHAVYKLPNGRIFVESCTPSDSKAEYNNLSVLRRILRGAQ